MQDREFAFIGAVSSTLVVAILLIGRRLPRRKCWKPQDDFRQVLANNSGEPFQHLAEDLSSLQGSDGPQIHPFGRLVSSLVPEQQQCLQQFSKRPPPVNLEQVIHVTSREGLEEAARKLEAATAVGVDVEHNHTRSYLGMTCLLQLHADETDYVVDALLLHDEMHLLRPMFANPAIVKVFHGGDHDMLWLQRDFHIYVANLFDTEKAAQVLGKEERSLQALLAKYAGIWQDKAHQLDDWRDRPLSEEMVQYAVADAHYLLWLAATLRQELLDAGASQLQTCFCRSQEVALQLYDTISPEAAIKNAGTGIYKKQGGRGTAGPGLQAKVLNLCRWRDRRAREADEGLQYILPNELLWQLADQRSAADVRHCLAEWDGSNQNRLAWQGPNKKMSRQIWATLECSSDSSTPHGSLHGQAVPRTGGKGPRLTRAQKRELVAEKFSAKKQVYENCRMLSQEGELLCFCDLKKISWYERKGLGRRICDDPPTLQLTFEHKVGDQDQEQDAYYSASRDNLCVVCASKQHLLRYRVVPGCYRKHFPVHQKSHRSHDVLLICFECHETAQKAAEQVKKEIARDTGVPLHPPSSDDESSLPHHARKAAVALEMAGERMPAERREQLEDTLRRHFKKAPTSPGEEAGGAEPAFPGAGISRDLLDQGLLAGLGTRRRQQHLRRMMRGRDRPQGLTEDGDGLAEQSVAGSGPMEERVVGKKHQDLGHSWHGRRSSAREVLQVVEILQQRGGDDALSSMIQRFRAAFVEATDPRHLPPFWQIDHNAVRQFGEYSVYRQHA